MNKPVKPNITIPESFAKNGIKTDFDSDLMTEGFDSLKPDVLAGDNLNKFIDDTYKGLNYGMAAADAINLIQEGETLTVQNGQLVSGSTGGGLELCDIGMALYVDETKGLRRYLNGQIVDINTNTQAFLNRLQEITTLHPSLLCTEDEWQSAKTMSAFGQVGKFVFNYSGDNIVSVRLPRVVNVQGLFDLQNLGMTVEAGLPNIQGWLSYIARTTNTEGQGVNGAFYDNGAGSGLVGLGSASRSNVAFNASRSSSIYGNSDTVQQEAIQYPYFIQIATGSETENNIINEIELNNPYSLFDSKYSDHELNNLSWLKSEGQWNAKAVYTDAYDKLLKVYNGTEIVEGLSVKLSTEECTDYDFVLNTADETFRLPLLDGSEDLVSDRYDDLGLKASGSPYEAPANGWFVLKKLTNAVNQNIQLENTMNTLFTSCFTPVSGSIIRDYIEAKRGDIVKVYYDAGATGNLRFIYARGNGSLYFYVGETVQNANLINAGRIGEQLATKTDMLQASGAGMPSNRYVDLTLGASGTEYTSPANGWVVIWINANTWLTVHTIEIYGPSFISYGVSGITGPRATLPLQKGQTFQVDYGQYPESARFYYAEGSKGE